MVWQLAAGGDFGELAKQYSQGPTAAGTKIIRCTSDSPIHNGLRCRKRWAASAASNCTQTSPTGSAPRMPTCSSFAPNDRANSTVAGDVVS